MPIAATDSKDHPQPWYVMCHLDPVWIEQILQRDSAGLFTTSDGVQLPPYRFYIPYHYMPHLSDPDKDGLRNDLHSFVFIQASEQRVDQIVKSDWNRRTRLHLYYYRDAGGEKVTVQDAEMQQFIRALQDHHLSFYFDQPIADFSVGDAVRLQIDPWRGRPAVIRAIRVKGGETSITVSLNIFNQTKSINFRHIHVGDVEFADETRGRLLSGNPVTNYEEEIIDILSHRYSQNASEGVAENDRLRLKRLSSYSHIYVEDAYDGARFAALKLICAYLGEERRKVDHLMKEVLSLLDGRTVPATDGDAYLMTALFITTRHPSWRDAVKAYRHTHPSSPDILRRYHTIVKHLKTSL